VERQALVDSNDYLAASKRLEALTPAAPAS
jgi:hypothetical protein